LVSIVRSLAPQQFVGSASSAAIPPQTQAYQQSYQQSNRQTSQPNDQSQFPEFDFDNLPAHLASWMNLRHAIGIKDKR
ncbi:hypothetical protein LINPERPRIM_LOCUS37043, partial [Linum perenne]